MTEIVINSNIPKKDNNKDNPKSIKRYDAGTTYFYIEHNDTLSMIINDGNRGGNYKLDLESLMFYEMSYSMTDDKCKIAKKVTINIEWE